MVALGAQTVLVEPGAQQPGALDRFQVGAAGRVGVLAVAGELHLAVAVAGQLLEHLAEARGQVAREGVAGGGVTDGVEDDAALVRRDEHLSASVVVAVAVAVVSAAVLGQGGGGAEDGGRDGSGRHGGARAEETAPAHTEAAAQSLVRGVGCGGGIGAGGVGVQGHEWPAFSVVAGSGTAGTGRCQCRVVHSR
ncbi:hypothetical protein SGRIM128S_09757 [Streptomyces griseomycini]